MVNRHDRLAELILWDHLVRAELRLLGLDSVRDAVREWLAGDDA